MCRACVPEAAINQDRKLEPRKDDVDRPAQPWLRSVRHPDDRVQIAGSDQRLPPFAARHTCAFPRQGAVL